MSSQPYDLSWVTLLTQVVQHHRSLEEEKEQTQRKRQLRSKQKERQSIKEPEQRAWKIRLYPNRIQRQRLNQWFRIYRWTYNRCVAFFNEINEKYKPHQDENGRWTKPIWKGEDKNY
eukprot:gb/GECH01007787.1/.p1 GENE.gb/GECH01007787.1/~~gb/GECH01007787.1/.p1  ORF type:complete len:117 (+),score=7.31 gb/GECH01007787.1/:1-351(+)